MISMLRAEWHCDLSAKAHALRVCLHAKPPRRIALSHPATTVLADGVCQELTSYYTETLQ